MTQRTTTHAHMISIMGIISTVLHTNSQAEIASAMMTSLTSVCQGAVNDNIPLTTEMFPNPRTENAPGYTVADVQAVLAGTGDVMASAGLYLDACVTLLLSRMEAGLEEAGIGPDDVDDEVSSTIFEAVTGFCHHITHIMLGDRLPEFELAVSAMRSGREAILAKIAQFAGGAENIMDLQALLDNPEELIAAITGHREPVTTPLDPQIE